MKFKAAIISLLSAMLVVGMVTATLLVTEAKKQTDIALKTAELTALQAKMPAYESMIQGFFEPQYTTLYENGQNAYFWNYQIEEIRKSLGLKEITDFTGLGFDSLYNQDGYFNTTVTPRQ